MKCTNESCSYRQEPGPIECPAANNGCEGYKSEKGGQPNESLHPANPKP